MNFEVVVVVVAVVLVKYRQYHPTSRTEKAIIKLTNES